MKVLAGATNVSVYFYVQKKATGEPLTGLLFSDIETGGSASYMRQGAARVDLTLITLASASAAHSDGGFILVDDTNMPGLYRCDYPDAAFASGVNFTVCQIVVATAKNAIVAPVAVDIEDKLTAAAANQIADHTIRRSNANAESSADGDTKSYRSLLGATAKLTNKTSITGATLTITESDDITALGTQALTTDAGAVPITAADTA